MEKRSLLFVVVVGLVSTISALAQCPKISVNGPSDTRTVGETITISSIATGGDPAVDPTYNWSVSAGKIIKGQGTFMIEVDSTDLGESSTLTATVEVGGYAKTCSASASTTSEFKKKIAAVKADEFPPNLKPKDEQARLIKVNTAFSEDPIATLYIIAYPSKKSKPGDAAAALSRIRDYLTNMRGIDPMQIKTIEGGERKTETLEFWIASYEAAPPVVTPPKP
jgi:hypothetical protein